MVCVRTTTPRHQTVHWRSFHADYKQTCLSTDVVQAGRLRFSLPEIFAAGVRTLQAEQGGSSRPASSSSASVSESAAVPAANESVAPNSTPGVEELDRFDRCVCNTPAVCLRLHISATDLRRFRRSGSMGVSQRTGILCRFIEYCKEKGYFNGLTPGTQQYVRSAMSCGRASMCR